MELSERRVEMLDRDQSVGVCVGKRPQEHRVHGAEDRGIGADAEREGEDDDERESRALQEAPETVADILQQTVHGWLDEVGGGRSHRGFDGPSPEKVARWAEALG